METSGFRHHHHHHHQSHVPQQSRRDKLRVQQQVLGSMPISHHHLDNDLPNSFDHHQHEFTTLHGQDHLNLQIHGRNVIRPNDNNFLYDHQAGNINVSSENILGDHHRPMSISPGSDVPQSLMINWPAVPTANFASSSAPRNNVLEQPQIISSQDHVRVQKYYLEGMHLTNDNDNMVGDQVVTVASTRDNELALLPFSFASLDTARGEDQIRSTTVVNDPNLQGLSLSLSSINPQHMARVADHHQGSSDSDQDLPKPIPKPSIIGKACGKSLQDIVGVSSGPGYRSNNTGPLGPFTGYATILKSSRFLKPAQQLLEEFCGSKLMMNEGNAATTSSSPCDVNSERTSGDLSASVSASDNRANVNTMDQTSCHDHHHQVAANISNNNNNNNNNNNSCASSSTFYGSNEINSGIGSSVSFESGSSRPEHVQQKKAKLLYMQEEVSRRYKQYRQQMQMVVSSFESVAGLSSATPYISLALKAVSRHFRCLKSALADQLNHTMSALGEENIFLSPAAGKAAADHSVRLKYMDQGFQKHRSAGGPNMAFHEPQQHHIWRPQRGLPERSVAVLRAWLFEHFLHPYPTDTDKHMLATQTGLTRNQVSNWFINARVRVWKPMVEEIHTLETKGLSGTDQGNGGPASSNDHVQASPAKLGNRSSVALLGADQHDEQSQEKRSRLDFAQAQAHQAPAGLAGSVVQGFVPYLRGGLEVWSRAEQ